MYVQTQVRGKKVQATVDTRVDSVYIVKNLPMRLACQTEMRKAKEKS